MKTITRLFVTALLSFGLMAPALHAKEYVHVAATTASASAGWSFGGPVGNRLGTYVADNIRGHEGKILIAGLIAIAAYYLYASNQKDAPNHHRKARSRCRTCSNKGCSHTKCK